MNLGALLPKPVLNINLFRLIARKSNVDFIELADRQIILPLELIQKIVGIVAFAENQPIPALGAGLNALFDEGAIRRDAGAGANHDDRPVAIYRNSEMPVWLDVDASAVANLAAVGKITRCDALAVLAMRMPAHRTDQQVGFALMSLQAGCHRIETPRQGPQQRQQLLGGELFLVDLEQIDELPISRKLREGIALEQGFDVGAAGQLAVIFDQRLRQRRDIETVLDLEHEGCVRAKPGGAQHLIDEFWIIVREHANGIARAVGKARLSACQFGVPGFARRASAVEIDERGNLGFERIFRSELWLGVFVLRSPAREIDVHDLGVGAGFSGGKSGERFVGPLRRLLGVIKIEVEPVGGARCTKGFKPGIDVFAGLTELRISCVAECKDSKPDTFQARRCIAHQGVIKIDGPAWRIAFAPGGGINDEVLGLCQQRQISVGHIEDLGIEAVLLRRLLGFQRQCFAIATFRRIQNSQRRTRLRGRDGLRRTTLRRFKSCKKSSKPAPLHRSRLRDHAIEGVDVLRRERRVLRQKWCRRHNVSLAPQAAERERRFQKAAATMAQITWIAGSPYVVQS